MDKDVSQFLMSVIFAMICMIMAGAVDTPQIRRCCNYKAAREHTRKESAMHIIICFLYRRAK